MDDGTAGEMVVSATYWKGMSTANNTSSGQSSRKKAPAGGAGDSNDSDAKGTSSSVDIRVDGKGTSCVDGVRVGDFDGDGKWTPSSVDDVRVGDYDGVGKGTSSSVDDVIVGDCDSVGKGTLSIGNNSDGTLSIGKNNNDEDSFTRNKKTSEPEGSGAVAMMMSSVLGDTKWGYKELKSGNFKVEVVADNAEVSNKPYQGRVYHSVRKYRIFFICILMYKRCLYLRTEWYRF